MSWWTYRYWRNWKIKLKTFLKKDIIITYKNNINMKIKLYWTEENTKELLAKVNNALDELGLVDFIKVETTLDEELKKELNITKEPALIVEEESIEFKDTIFEWIIPEDDEIKSMFISIIGWWESGWWCAPEWCGSWCSC